MALSRYFLATLPRSRSYISYMYIDLGSVLYNINTYIYTYYSEESYSSFHLPASVVELTACHIRRACDRIWCSRLFPEPVQNDTVL